jgi:hypothetical protein
VRMRVVGRIVTRMHRTRIMLGVAVALAGCGSSGGGPRMGRTPRQSSSGVVIRTLVLRGDPALFVRLTVKGHPYMFAVDTGAARTVVDATVAKALALPARGAAYSAVTIGCKTSVQLVAVSDWKLGEATLPAKTIVSAKTVFAGAMLNGIPIGGLLGSDVLSRFGTVTLDFAGQRLILRGKAPSDGRTIPVKVERYKDGKVPRDRRSHDWRQDGRLRD